MKDGMRFVDCDMHVMEPADLFDRYLDPKFQHRVISAPGRAGGTQMVIDGLSRAGDDDLLKYQFFLRIGGSRGEARTRNRTCNQSAMHCLANWRTTDIHQHVPLTGFRCSQRRTVEHSSRPTAKPSDCRRYSSAHRY